MKRKRVLIVSTCAEEWGGSEELWARTIPHLHGHNVTVTVTKYYINRQHPEFVKLASMGVELIEIFPPRSLFSKMYQKTCAILNRLTIKLNLLSDKGEDFSSFIKILKLKHPSLVIVSQGINFDGLKLAYQCHLFKIPYTIISQKAVDFYWPHKDDRKFMLKALLNAERCFFVSKHNLRLTEEQFGSRLPNAEVIFNPVKMSGNVVPYPKSEKGYKLACLGRLFLLDKGQDMLIRILDRKIWRDRPIRISFIGKGTDEVALKEMATLLNITNIDFKGQIEDVEEMWKDFHALILPSRSEGLPLSMVEAMSAGRPVIISNAGGNAELIEDGKTAFIGHPNEDSFADAMERAWNRRDEWEEIGRVAAKKISELVPPSPEAFFAEKILSLLK